MCYYAVQNGAINVYVMTEMLGKYLLEEVSQAFNPWNS